MPDDQPPDLDGPDDHQPPDMPEPDNAPAVRVTSRPLFPRAPAPPVGASPLMVFILSVITDPTARRQIQEAAWSLNAGLDEDHLLTKAAALLSAVEQAHIARAALIFTENRRVLTDMGALLSDIGTVLAEREINGQQEAPDAEGDEPGQKVSAGAPGFDMTALRAAFRKEADAAVRDSFKMALKFGAGGIVVGLLIAFVIHIL